MTRSIISLGELIKPAKMRRAGFTEYPILSMTMHSGLVDQDQKFKKRIASLDTSTYKVVTRGQLVVGFPIDEGVLSFQNLYKEAIVSPAYEIWDIVDPSRIDNGYLERYLRSPQALKYYHSKLRGTTARRRSLPKDIFLKLPVTLPSISEQHRIVQVLDGLDTVRTKRREAIKLLESLRQSTFLDMFGDPVSNPKNWPTVQLSKLGTLDRGVSKHRPRNAPELLGGSYPLIQTGDVAASKGYIKEWKSTYSDAGFSQSKLWPAGTLCITIAANIAKTGILKFDACFPDSVVGFSSDPHIVEYVQVWLSFLQKNLERLAPESAQKNINLAVLRELNIPYPDSSLISSFTERVGAANALQAKFRSHLAELDALFASLQYRAFRGEL